MNAAITMMSVLFSVLVPQKMWVAPSQPLMVQINSDKDATLLLTDFAGKAVAAKGSADVSAGQSVDVKTVFPIVAAPGTYVLYALPKGAGAAGGAAPKDFLGTPIVIEVLAARFAQDGTAMTTHIVPLQYATMDTDAGKMTMIFYYDSAPHTVQNFLDLGSEGYYDGLNFHRVVPGFVIQGGDPTATGMGGPGYEVTAEFNDKPHEQGVLSMARSQDPNSAGSQFFVCLDYNQTQNLDHKYTAFGRVIKGMEAVQKIAAGKLADPQAGRPETPVNITKFHVLPVKAGDDPYEKMMSGQ
jgi:cyclophilin family peptidyl-prolyl cis-trans isomerase